MIGYLDLPSGISGDMLLGCLIDAGWEIDRLRATIQRLRLPADEWAVGARCVLRGALQATLVDVKVAKHAGEGHGRSHRHDHQHRNLHDIRHLIEASDLPRAIQEKSIAVFLRLARAEATVHGATIEKIHFHEVGALDAIVDIVGGVAGLHELGIERLYASALPLGSGWIECQHGRIPLPAPATLELLSAAGAPTCPAPGPGELVTPTGAALVAELASFAQPPMTLRRVAMGAGQKQTEWPNVARLWLGDAGAPTDLSISDASMVQIETNIDDMNPQLYGPLGDRLFAAGAVDVWLMPIQMKKGRPGVMLGALAAASAQRAVADVILSETTTLGVRITPVHRYEAQREIQPVSTPHGLVQVKLKRWGGQLLGATPEYEDCRRLAESCGVPVRAVYEAALSAAHQQFLSPQARPDEGGSHGTT